MRVILSSIILISLISCKLESSQQIKSDESLVGSTTIGTNNENNLKETVNQEFLCSCFLLDSGFIVLYDEINNTSIDSIGNDYEIEDFYTLNIIEQKGKWFKVNAQSIEKKKAGWIMVKDFPLGTYAANYTGVLHVYENPNKHSKIKHTFPEYFTEPLKIVRCVKDWVEIRLEKEGKIYQGWVLQSMTCPSPYTTCN